MQRKTQRPWGSFDTLKDSNRYWVKLITVYPGHETSLQRHASRSEVWVLVNDTGAYMVREGGSKVMLVPGVPYHIPANSIHRLGCLEDSSPAKVVEVAYGIPLESDIERLDDNYGRDQS